MWAWWHRLINCVRQPGKTRRRRIGRTALNSVAALESRALLSGQAIVAADPALVQVNAQTGAITATRYNGDQFVSEATTNLAAIGAKDNVFVADFTGDGVPEVIGHDPNTGYWYAIDQSSGTWQSRVIGNWNAAVSYQTVQVADVDGNGTADIVGKSSDGNWWALKYNGASYVNAFLGGWTKSVTWQNTVLGDMDGNGSVDILSQIKETGNWWVIRSTSGGMKNEFAVTWNPAHSFTAVQMLDVNGDQRKELIGFDQTDQTWHMVSFNPTTQTYSDQVVANWGNSGHSWANLLVGDRDGNGVVDFIGRNPAAGFWYASAFGAANTAPKSIGWWNPADSYSNLQVIDINNDGVKEIVGLNQTGSWWALTLQGNKTLGGWSPAMQNIQIVDLNGDGKKELVGYLAGTGKWWSLQWNGTTYQASVVASWDSTAQYLYGTAIDLNHDRQLEFIGWNQLTGQWIVSQQNATAATFKSLARWTPALKTRYVGMVDLTGDGDADIISVNDSTGDYWVTTLPLTNPENYYLGRMTPGINWDTPFFVDFQGNGIRTMVARNLTTGDWRAWNLADKLPAGKAIGNWSTTSGGYQNFMTLDLNGDGRQELVARGGDNSWWALINTGAGIRNQYLYGWSAGVNWQNIVTGDFNGDGRADIAARNPQNNAWWMISSNGSSYQSTQIGGWTSGAVVKNVLTGDLNADNATDLVGNVNGVWSLLSWNGSGFTAKTLGSWSISNSWNQVLLADLNGDHKAELVGRNGSTGVWTAIWWQSTIAAIQTLGIDGFTTQTVTAQVADIDGNGTQDLLIRSLQNGQWFVIRSATGGITSTTLSTGTGDAAHDFFTTNTPGFSDSALRALLLNQISGLRAALSNDRLTAARLLQHWVAVHTNNAYDAGLANYSTPLVASQSAAANYFGLFASDTGGVWCGGYAWFFQQVLTLFNYDSWTMDFGDSVTQLTHVTDIVAIPTGNTTLYYLIDSLFDTSFYNSQNQLLSLTDLLAALKSQTLSSITVTAGDLTQRHYLSGNPTTPTNYFEYRQLNLKVSYRPDFTISDYLAQNAATILSLGLTPDLAGLLKLVSYKPVTLRSKASTTATQSLKQLLTSYNITVAS